MFLDRLESYRRLVAARDLSGVAHRLGDNVRRRLEKVATRRLGVRPSARQIDENVRLAMVDAYCAYEGEPVDVAMDVILGTDNAPADVTAILAAWERLAVRGVTPVRVPGCHDTALVAPAVDAVAAVIDGRLADLEPTGTRDDVVTPLPTSRTRGPGMSPAARPA